MRGPQVAGEYLHRKALSEDGWFATNDAGWLDEEGFLFVDGRLDDVVPENGGDVLELFAFVRPAQPIAPSVGALARAMLLNPNIMVCDEPTNAMDMQAEEAFGRYIQKEIKGRTLILVTHKTAMLPLVDRLILLDQGRVLMDGPRDKVIEALSKGKIEVKS